MSEQKAPYVLDPGETVAERAETLLDQAKDAVTELFDALDPLFDEEGRQRVEVQAAKSKARTLAAHAQELMEFIDSLE